MANEENIIATWKKIRLKTYSGGPPGPAGGRAGGWALKNNNEF